MKHREDMIEDLIARDVQELVNLIKSGPTPEVPGNLRHWLYEGIAGYRNWSDEDILKEWEYRR